MPILEVTDFHKSYPAFKLENISFTLEENCITGFIGANGAGKTTMIKAILGLIREDSGSIKLFGKDMTVHEKELKNRIGIVFDEGYFYEDLTLLEMKSILSPAYAHWDNEAFKKYINEFNLDVKQKIATLSKGMRMKFALALALSHNADLLIMDEPTSGLDPVVRREMIDILLEFVSGEGKSVFFSTHITSDLETAADMLILIDKGKILFDGNKDSLIESHAIAKGDTKLLTDETRKLFLSLNETPYNFTGLTKSRDDVRHQINGVLFEKPTIEDIMLTYIRR